MAEGAGAAPEVPAHFEREQGFTDSDWQRCLPGAVAPHTLALPAPGHAVVTLGDGRLVIRWTVLPARRIALLSLPRLAVAYAFEAVDAETRRSFMRRFDLWMQRGGG